MDEDEVNELSFKRKTRKIKGIYLQLTLFVKKIFFFYKCQYIIYLKNLKKKKNSPYINA